MTLRRDFLLPVLAIAMILAFQNCGRTPSDVDFSGAGSKVAMDTDNGQHYDGKLYVLIGDICSDGSNIQSRIRVNTIHSADLLRQDCKDITPVTLADGEFQFNPSNAEELIYQSKVYTATAGFVAPKLTNPVSPIAYGAKCDGVTDDTAAFQAAIDASDVLVPAGTCVIKKTLFIQASNKHFECQPGATLTHPDPYIGKMIHITPPTGTSITDVSIVNCGFRGANSVAPQYFTDGRQNDSAININIRVNNLLIAGNTFDRFYGDGTVQTYAPTAADTGRGYQIVHNTFKSCGRYGPLFNGTIEGTIGYNSATDCNIGVSNDNTAQASGNNVIEYNKVTAVFGVGSNSSSAAAFVTGGLLTNGTFSTNIVRYNTVSGMSRSDGFLGTILPTRILQKTNAGTLPAQYIGNTCTDGCTIANF